MQACLQSLLRCSLSYEKIMQTESRDASSLAIFAEVQLIFYKSKTIMTKRQTFNLCFLHSFTQSRARGSESTRKMNEKKQRKKINEKINKKKTTKKPTKKKAAT